MVKRVLMIAYHYPPVHGSSGVQRALKFSRYLPDHGWQPIVLTVHPRAYLKTTTGQLDEIPPTAIVKCAFALDTARHLAVRGRYPGILALPDRWASWWLGAVPAGLNLIRQYSPDVIWSTYPIATAHWIALTLHRLSGIPWVADFRDSMTEDSYPSDPSVRGQYLRIERETIRHCDYAVFTTPGVIRMYSQRYPEVPTSRWKKIENGFDEENFRQAQELVPTGKRPTNKIILVHSGLLYPSERDPSAFFAALAELRQAGALSSASLEIVLRASGYEEHLQRMIDACGLQDMVRLAPAIPYREALAEMLNADGLLIFQASNCNHQIPAKIYEYLRARRPILALTDPAGDTAGVLRAAGIDTLVPLDSKELIVIGLRDFLARIGAGNAPIAASSIMAGHTRESRTGELAGMLDSLL